MCPEIVASLNAPRDPAQPPCPAEGRGSSRPARSRSVPRRMRMQYLGRCSPASLTGPILAPLTVPPRTASPRLRPRVNGRRWPFVAWGTETSHLRRARRARRAQRRRSRRCRSAPGAGTPPRLQSAGARDDPRLPVVVANGPRSGTDAAEIRAAAEEGALPDQRPFGFGRLAGETDESVSQRPRPVRQRGFFSVTPDRHGAGGAVVRTRRGAEARDQGHGRALDLPVRR